MKFSSYTVNEQSISSHETNSKLPQYFAAAAVTVGGFTMGSALGWSSPSLPDLEATASFELDAPWVGSILTLGAAGGSLLSGLTVDWNWLGRKGTMMSSAVLFLGGWIILSMANSMGALLGGRLLTGFGVGVLSLVAPIYLSEISQSEVRGIIGVGFQLMVVLGGLFSTILGSLSGWKVLSTACVLIPLIFMLGLAFLPESPRFLMMQGKSDEALEALSWLRNNSQQVKEEFETLQENSPKSGKLSPSFSISHIFSRSEIWKPIILTISLVLFNQTCGFSALNFYTVDIFRSLKNHGDSLDSNLCAVLVQLVQVFAVLLSSLLVDRIGRRILLLASFVIMAMSLVGLGFVFHFPQSWSSMPLLPLLLVILYNGGYSIGIGSLVWTIMSELLPPSIVGVVYSLETSYNWGLAFFITKYFHGLKNVLSIQMTFWMFGGLCILSGIVVALALPETRQKSLQEIQEEFKSKKKDSSVDLVC